MKVFSGLSRRPGTALSFLLLMGLVLGCGDRSKGTLSGTVTYKDKPLPGGTMLFVSAKGVERGEIKADGTYRVSGVPVGTVKVAVEPLPQVSPEIQKKMEQGWGGKKRSTAANPSSAGSAVNIPPRYKDPETSGLSCTVQGGNQDCNFSLD